MGGLQTFLLQSPSFIRIGSQIGLAEHAVGLQQVEGASLDQLAHFEYPDMNPMFPCPHTSAITSDPNIGVLATGDVFPILPETINYYYYPPAPVPNAAHLFLGSAFRESDPSIQWANVDTQQLPSYYLPNDMEEVDLYSAETDETFSSSMAADKNILCKHAAVQVSTQFHPEKRRPFRDFKIDSLPICFTGFSGDEERYNEY